MNLVRRTLLYTTLVSLLAASEQAADAQTLHVDPSCGDDANPGSPDLPIATMRRAATIANAGEGGGTRIRLHPGLHVLDESILFERAAPYGHDQRLIIEAFHLPRDPDWSPALMPVVVSTEKPELDGVLCAYGFRIEVNHASVRGIKFLGNPWPGTHYYTIWRGGMDLEDLVVTQCLFVGDRDALPIHLPIIANGHGLVVDHCIFSGCKNSVVFWNGPDEQSFGNSMRYCIVEGAYASAVWTCSTGDDFAFHNNILTRSRYAWIREDGSQRHFRIENSVITGNEQRAGYGGGVAAGFATTDADFLSLGDGVVTEGDVVLSRDVSSRDYLHVAPGTLGSDLGAGLFLSGTD